MKSTGFPYITQPNSHLEVPDLFKKYISKLDLTHDHIEQIFECITFGLVIDGFNSVSDSRALDNRIKFLKDILIKKYNDSFAQGLKYLVIQQFKMLFEKSSSQALELAVQQSSIKINSILDIFSSIQETYTVFLTQDISATSLGDWMLKIRKTARIETYEWFKILKQLHNLTPQAKMQDELDIVILEKIHFEKVGVNKLREFLMDAWN